MARLGFCIVKNVLSKEECEDMERLMNEDLAELVDEEELVKMPESVQSAWKKAKQQVSASSRMDLDCHDGLV